MRALVLILLLWVSNISLAQEYSWVKHFGGVSDDQAILQVDSSGNVYCYGSFTYDCQIDSLHLFSNGRTDLFLAKFDSSGKLRWLKQMGGPDFQSSFYHEGGSKIVVSGSSIYITGRYYQQMHIDSVYVFGDWAIFLAKLDTSGTCHWIKSASSDKIFSFGGPVCCDTSSHIYWGGYLDNSGTFDTIQLDKGEFLAKIHSNGTLEWIRPLVTGGSFREFRFCEGDLFCIGTTDGDPVTIDTISLAGDWSGTIVARLNETGDVNWAKLIGGDWTDYGITLLVDNKKSSYSAIYFSDSLICDSILYTAGVGHDMFLSRMDSSGFIKWVVQTNVSGKISTCPNNMAGIFDSTFYVVGEYSGQASFGDHIINSGNNKDMFVAKFDTSGHCIGVVHKLYENDGSTEVNGIALDANENLYLTGNFYDTLHIGNQCLISRGSRDIFLAKMGPIIGEEHKVKHPEQELLIYANPNKGIFDVVVPAEVVDETSLILKIYDSSGRLIKSQTINMADDPIHLDVSPAKAGMYHIQLISSRKTYSGKLVVY